MGSPTKAPAGAVTVTIPALQAAADRVAGAYAQIVEAAKQKAIRYSAASAQASPQPAPPPKR